MASVVNPPTLSVVIPVFDEAATLDELLRRCSSSAQASGHPFEIIVVDDASRDPTPARLAAWTGSPSTVGIRLERNLGQFGATRVGLRAARGGIVVVLDGDLQDPPEVLVKLVGALDAASPDVGVVFAVKERRADPGWFRAGAAAYRVLLGAGAGRVPRGAGSFCAMRRSVADAVASVDAGHANLAAVVAATGVVSCAIPYRKEARRDGTSRVGAVRLVAEAAGSLAAVGASSRLLFGAVVLLGVLTVVLASALGRGVGLALLLATFAAAAGLARARQARQRVQSGLAEAALQAPRPEPSP